MISIYLEPYESLGHYLIHVAEKIAHRRPNWYDDYDVCEYWLRDLIFVAFELEERFEDYDGPANEIGLLLEAASLIEFGQVDNWGWTAKDLRKRERQLTALAFFILDTGYALAYSPSEFFAPQK